MGDSISARLRGLIIQRAEGRCEYCLIHQSHTLLPHHVDHIISRKHEGKTRASNLALACADCNWAKGSDIAAVDSVTGKLVFFFNPRQHRWHEHFRIERGEIVPITPEARATVRIFQFNIPERVQERVMLQQLGLYL